MMIKSSILSDLFTTVSDRGRALLGTELKSDGDGALPLIAHCEALISGQGEATGMALAREILTRFDALDDGGRLEFFTGLATSFGPDDDSLGAAISKWQDDPTGASESDLHFASEPRRQELFRRLNRSPGGTRALVAMRTAILDILPDHPDLEIVDRDLHHLLSSWFNRGFLTIERIEWSTPASILEKIIRYEAVHEIQDWDDLRRRVDAPDRRCYGFFHPTLGDEPLIFVEVALTHEIPSTIEPILADDREPDDLKKVNTAVFYSISNCQEGLRGVSFGNFLIKQVVDELKRDLPDLANFVTLSPVPRFRRWLEQLVRDENGGEANTMAGDALRLIGEQNWFEDPDAAKAVMARMMPLAAHYLLTAKNGRGEPFDPVARFHLGNGARLERINWLGDVSEQGLSGGAGLMVNYLYDLRDVERNHEAFVNGEIVASSKVVKLNKAFR
jgi:malonyl-CoA decarboxylase